MRKFMQTVQTSQVLANSKFNKFHLLVFLWCFFAITFDGYDVALYGIGLPMMMEDFNITVVEAGAISSYSVIGTMIGTFLFGSISDVIGRKKAIAICLILFSCFTFFSGFAPNADIFLIMRIIACMGLGGVMPILVAVMTEYAPKKIRALTVAIMYCGYSIGAIFASLIGMYWMESLGWRFLYWISIIPFIALPFFMKQFPESVSYYLRRKQGDKIASILNKIEPDGNYQATDKFDYKVLTESTKKLPIKKVFSDNRIISTLAFWLAMGCSMLVITGLTTWLPKIMMESGHGLSSSLSFNLVLSLGQMTGSIFGGILVGRIGHRRVLVSMFFIGALSFVLLSLTSHTLILYLLIALTGACTVGTQNLVNPYVSEYYPREIRATGLSIAVGVGRIGGILAPVAIAFLLTTNLAPQHAFMAFAIPSLLGAISFMIVQEKYASFDRVVQLERRHTA
ncbi:MFS transporter [Oceanobacillus piezotolerans]|uniref:MFS transporter n=1 Tax=Oceanobacillus piezotolerans TaxID=2448030 RepID=A0A498D4F4_9BACI|nr:MFS transporter [Oceanobacillus piezotolerans]RLL40397.1 MFS transporter [Oceanobacillus piezotolerans]